MSDELERIHGGSEYPGVSVNKGKAAKPKQKGSGAF
jgi:hypothetical protein